MSLRTLLFRRPTPPSLWQGVYSRYEDVPSRGALFADESWVAALQQEVDIARHGEVSREFVLEHEILLLALDHLASLGRPIHVLDFGGGAGASYAWLRRQQPALSLEYRVVELPDAVRLGTTLFADDAAVRFDCDLGQVEATDIVFVKSVLQYVPDYKATLRALLRRKAHYVILEKFSGIEGASYASAQVNVPGSSIPYWFISFDEALALAQETGYERRLTRRLPRHYPHADVPASMRMEQASSIVFAKV